jgi:hypothetical protein
MINIVQNENCNMNKILFSNRNKIYLIVIVFVFYFISCVDNKKVESTNEIHEKEKPEIAYLFPEKLSVKSNTHDLLTNVKLFMLPVVKKGTSGQQVVIDSMSQKYDQVNYLLFDATLKQTIKPSTSANGFSMSLTFECEQCQSAFLVLSKPNDYSILNDMLGDNLRLSKKFHKITRNESGRYSYNLHVNELGSGWGSNYLILTDSLSNSSLFEIASQVTDISPPVFSRFYIEFLHPSDPTYEGLVVLDTKEFSGNEYDGFDVPFKGTILGDIKVLKVAGRTMQLKGEDFFQRVHLRLKIGYNQIPITIIDKVGNITESYLETTIEYIDKGPFIENNIYN